MKALSTGLLWNPPRKYFQTYLMLITAKSSSGQTSSGVLSYDSICCQVEHRLERANSPLRFWPKYSIDIQTGSRKSVQRGLQIPDFRSNHPSFDRHLKRASKDPQRS